MSKSMWIDAVLIKPVQEDAKTSINVLFWQEGNMCPCWGYYNYDSHVWFSISNNSIARTPVKYFAYISNPYK